MVAWRLGLFSLLELGFFLGPAGLFLRPLALAGAEGCIFVPFTRSLGLVLGRPATFGLSALGFLPCAPGEKGGLSSQSESIRLTSGTVACSTRSGDGDGCTSQEVC